MAGAEFGLRCVESVEVLMFEVPCPAFWLVEDGSIQVRDSCCEVVDTTV